VQRLREKRLMVTESAALPLLGADRAQSVNSRRLLLTPGDCRADEVAHRDEAAAARGLSQSGWVLRGWCAMVGAGSKAAVTLIRHI